MRILRTNTVREFKGLATIGWPIVITQVSQVANSVVDVLISGNYSATAQAGVALGSSLFWPLYLLVSGTLMAVTPTISQMYGGGLVAQTGAVARQAFWLAVLGVFIAVIVLLNSRVAFELIGVDPIAIPVAHEFLQIMCFGVAGLFGFNVLRYLFEGLAFTQPAMYITVGALALKTPLTYLFVFGSPGLIPIVGESIASQIALEPIGAKGCALATVIAIWCQFVAMLVAAWFTRVRQSRFFARIQKPDWALLWRLARLGVPIGLSIFVEVAFFSGITVLVGTLGVKATASHQSAMNIASIAFMFPLAFGMASTIRISAHIGARRYYAASIAAKVAVSCSLLFGLCMMVLMLLFRHPLADLYSIDPEVVQLTATLLVYGALFQMFDATQVTMVGALRGFKDTAVPMTIILITLWIVALPIGMVLAYGWPDFIQFETESASKLPLGVEGFWWSLLIGLGLLSIAMGVRLWYFARQFPRDPVFRRAHLKI